VLTRADWIRERQKPPRAPGRRANLLGRFVLPLREGAMAASAPERLVPVPRTTLFPSAINAWGRALPWGIR
jgi:hypothetical protein